MKAARKMSVAVKPIPEGYHSITPFLTVRYADQAIDFYRRAFGAEETGPDARPGWKDRDARGTQDRRFPVLPLR